MKKLLYAFLFLMVAAALAGLYLYNNIWTPNVKLGKPSISFNIPSGTNYEQLSGLLLEKNVISDKSSFDLTSKLMKYQVGQAKAH